MVEPVRVDDELWARADAIPGWFSRDEAELVLAVCASPWCEVGSYRGRSAVILASTGPGTVVDHFRGTASHPEELSPDNYREFLKNTRGLPITVLHGDFEQMAPRVGEIRFLHLDADHSYEATARAFQLYAPKLVAGGYLALHDAWGENGEKNSSGWPGSMRFAKELIRDPGWEHVGDARRLAAFRKL